MLMAVVVLVLFQTFSVIQPCLLLCSKMDMLLHLTYKEDIQIFFSEQIFYSESSKMLQCPPRLPKSYISMRICNRFLLIYIPLYNTLIMLSYIL